MHACYGIGAASGPVIMTSVLGAGLPWQWGYGLVGVGQLVLAGCFALTHTRWPTARVPSDVAATVPFSLASGGSVLRLPGMWLSIAAFFIYAGLEATAGTWAYSLFTEARAIPMHTAGLWVSIYWATLTVGRLLFGLVVGSATVHILLCFCMASIAVGAALVWLNINNTLSSVGLAVIGLASGPVFPSLIATTPGRLGEAQTASGVGLQIAAAALGQSLLPGIVGMLTSTLGLEIIGPTLLTAAIVLLSVYVSLTAASTQQASVGRSTAAGT